MKRLLLLLFTISTIVAQDFSFFHEGNGYEVFNLTKKWDEAEQFCNDRDAHLITITSEEENNFLSQYICSGFSGTIPLGVIIDNSNIPEWITGEQTNYNNWNIGDMNNNYGEFYCI